MFISSLSDMLTNPDGAMQSSPFFSPPISLLAIGTVKGSEMASTKAVEVEGRTLALVVSTKPPGDVVSTAVVTAVGDDRILFIIACSIVAAPGEAVSSLIFFWVCSRSTAASSRRAFSGSVAMTVVRLLRVWGVPGAGVGDGSMPAWACRSEASGWGKSDSGLLWHMIDGDIGT